MVMSKQRIDVVQALLFDISECLDFVCNFLNVVISQLQVELFGTILDSIPSSQTMSNVNISSNSKIFRFQNLIINILNRKIRNYLISRRIVQNGFGVNTSFVSKCRESSYIVAKRNLNVYEFGDIVFDITKHSQIVFGANIFRIDSIHSSDESKAKSVKCTKKRRLTLLME